MIKVSAKQTTLRVGKYAGKERFVMMARTYSTLSDSKVIQEASLRTGLPKSVVRACWEGCGEVISAWCVEGHSVALPGLGHMRFGIRAASVEKVEDVSTNLITSRRVIFLPSVAIKEELAKTSISITCYDKEGKRIKTVTSTDKDDIEEDDGNTTPGGGEAPGGGGDNEGGGNSGGSGDGGDDLA